MFPGSLGNLFTSKLETSLFFSIKVSLCKEQGPGLYDTGDRIAAITKYTSGL